MKLSRETIRDIMNMAEHYLDDTDDTDRAHELSSLVKLLENLPRRFAIEIKRVELVPETADLILNVLIKHVMELIDTPDGAVNEENAVWEYMKLKYGYDIEEDDDDYYLKATFEEAISYAIIKNFPHIIEMKQ